MTKEAQHLIEIIQERYGNTRTIPLHEPTFIGNEKKYVNDAIDSSYVSSVGIYVKRVESEMCRITKSDYAVATINGTAGLHLALVAAGVSQEDEVFTQPLSFVATANAIAYCGAQPHFVDIEPETLGLSPAALENRINEIAELRGNYLYNKNTNKRIKACLVMHTFGFASKAEQIAQICEKYNLTLIEDAAEALGTQIKKKHVGRFGAMGVFSFNGNKITTAGGGGCIITDNPVLAKRLKHLSTTAKVAHKWEYNHDQIGYNYRMPNLNAALLLAQLENLSDFLENKRETAIFYKQRLSNLTFGSLFWELKDTTANFWLNTFVLDSAEERDNVLWELHAANILARPVWKNLDSLKPFLNCQKGNLEVTSDLVERIINIPSSFVAD